MSLSDTNPNVLDLCRLCLGKDERLIPVFDNLHTNQVLCDKINVCLAIQISSEDRISQKICTSCYIKVDSFYEFRNTSSESQRVLERWLQNTENTLTDLNPQEANNIIKDGNSLFIDDVTSDEESDDRDSLSDGDNNLNPVETSESLQLIQENDELPSVSNDDLITLLPATNEDPGPSGLHSTDTVALIELLDRNSKNEGNKRVPQQTLHTCEYCGESFTKFKLEVHRRKHTGERPYKCPEPGCTWAFASKGMLTSHGKVHTNERPHVCSYCNRSFKTAVHLTNHVKTHTGEKSYYCDLCDYSSIYKATLLIHRKRHLKEYSVICEVCGKGFYNTSDLKEHMSGHTGDTPYSCDLCNDKYCNKYQLRKHKIMHHRVQNTFPPTPVQCEKCPRLCPDKRSYRNHMRRVHAGKVHECEICGKRVRNKAYLVEHLRIHSGEKPYLCKLCGKSFAGRKTIRMHEVVHTGEKRYQCGTCNKRFTQKSSLNAHKKLHNQTVF